jgi:signal peptidase II
MSSMPAQRRLIVIIAASVVILDAVTKAIAARALAGRGVVNVFGGAFHLELYRNFAGPGNVLTGHPVLVSLLSLTAVALICVIGWSVRATGYAVALGLLLGGGVGNLLDRLLRAPGPLRGGVVDWIKPTLSSGSLDVADLSINAAILAMVVAVALDAIRQRRRRGSGAPGVNVESRPSS